jgi:hypothetical protein
MKVATALLKYLSKESIDDFDDHFKLWRAP